MNHNIIIALDFANKAEVERFLEHFNEEKLFLKVGMELFYKEGAAMIKELKAQGHQIFLDLKCHDIPNTVAKAMQQLKILDVDLVNVHAAGGSEMMQAAKKAFGSSGKMIAVTQLTSINEDILVKEQLIKEGLAASVKNYAQLSQKSGLDGVVCSAHEARMIKEICGPQFITVCPGIRLPHDALGDQKRVMTPAKAKENGADYIVVGRSITQAEKPYEVYKKVEKMWLDA